jgi:hypothetical protein
MRRAGALVLGLALAACDGEVECEVACSAGDSTVQRTFPSCSSLRDEIDRRSSSGTITECEAQALESCEQTQCGSTPL